MGDSGRRPEEPLIGEKQPFAGFRFRTRGQPRTVSPVNLGELLNLVGLSTGVALYAMLLAMVIRARRRAGAAAFDPLLLLTSVLGLLWNLCALPGYVLPKFGIADRFR